MPQTARATAFYPSMVVNLALRFDEAFHVVTMVPPTSIDQILGSSLGGVPPSTLADEKPLIVSGGADNLSQVMERIPKAASVELPGYRQAGKFNLSFDFRDLPLDPRLIRACGVEIHLGAVDPDDFAQGMSRAPLPIETRRRSILRTRDAAGRPRSDTLLMAGLVDTWSVEHGANGSEVHMEGRDLRGIFLDSPVNPKLFTKLNLANPIDEVVAEIIGKHPMGSKFTVVVNPDDWPQPFGPPAPAGPPGSFGPPAPTFRLPSPAVQGGLTRVRLGADGKGGGSAQPAGDPGSLNYWDLITRYCFLVGAIPYFKGYQLEIRPARSVYDVTKLSGFDPRFPTPFKGGKPRTIVEGTPPSPDQLQIRRMVYGRDLLDLKFERKFHGTKVRVVECVSVDTSSKKRGAQRLLIARWPQPSAKQGALTTSVAPSGAVSSEDVLRIPVPGISDQNILLEIAKDLFEEIGRGEMGGSFETRDLASFGGDNADPDLLTMHPGDAVEFVVDTRGLGGNVPLVSELTDRERTSFEEEVQHIKARLGGGGENLARVIVATARNGVKELQLPFRVQNVKYDWAVGDGVKVSADFQNFVEARYGVTPTRGKNRSPVKKTVSKTPATSIASLFEPGGG